MKAILFGVLLSVALPLQAVALSCVQADVDDTEDMTGVSIFTPISKSKDRFHDNTVLTEIPPELDIYNEGFNYAQEKIDKERESNTR